MARGHARSGAPVVDKRTSLIERRVLNVYQDVDRVVRFRAHALKASCSAGCSHCCHQYTPITLPEAITLVQHVRAKPGGEAELDGHLVLSRIAVPGGDRTGDRCPLLGLDNLCQGYAARPMACRTHLVVSEPGLCDETKVGIHNVQIIGMTDLHARTLAKLGILSFDVKLEELWIGPLSVMLILAAIIVRDGWDAFVRSQEAPEHPMLDLRRWIPEARRPEALGFAHAHADSGRCPSTDRAGGLPPPLLRL